MKKRLVDTEALVLWMSDHIEEGGCIEKLPRVVYNWARDGKITRHGGRRRGQALWDLDEVERILDRGETSP